jgi:REP-associated tyrosine transposase
VALPKIYYERNLPHWHPTGKCLFLTWRLYGSLPANVAGRYRQQEPRDAGRAFVEVDRALDRGSTGPRWLIRPALASLVVAALRRGASELRRFELHAYVVMANHVHVLLDPMDSPARILQGIKGSTARLANAALGRERKRFWQDESFDRWVRSAKEFARIRAYIEWNPVTARLAQRPECWPWSSAARRK